MPPIPDVVIAGGGIIGSACAWALARAGQRVKLIERGGEAGEAWRASAGVLAAQLDAHGDSAELAAGVAGREFYHEVEGELEERTGIAIGLVQPGLLRVAEDVAEATQLREQVAWQRQQGQRAEWVTRDALRQDWPWLARAEGGAFAPRDGAVNPVRVVEALRQDAVRAGVELVADEVRGLLGEAGRVSGVLGRDWHPAGKVVIATGAWSGSLANLPRRLPVEPIRGVLAAYPWPGAVAPAIVFGWGGYVLERNGEAIAGSTMENAGFDARVTEPAVRTVRSQAEQLVPGFARQAPTRSWAGLRPMTPDGRPIVGADPGLAGLWYATGHGRNGVLYAGATAGALRDLMAGASGPDWGSGWSPARFG